ncbi:MAG: hypothetical protein US31_C0006G0004 [Berkelbacteria bacterium GW2011_GWA1_36_9]|uniref:General secretion pathway protein G n=1 Tax=Berkelbacteria bacterium GW2011_GWA1_36_9 TaxID=1618331 RepID=A0A0G0FGR8_9BACT|nr:MAG: hypothetical protein US31_C0006G0004 [Berkelbacteria bacterium GW2011_GWA1_36_9]
MKKGFTLIELLVVMFIIAILASLVIVNVNSARKTARDAKRMSDLKSIQGALEMYNNKSGSYPKTFYTKGSAGCDTGFVLSGSICKLDHSATDGTTGMNGIYNPDSYFSNTDLTKAWIPGLIPDYLPLLPQDPKKTVNDSGYQYKSNGTDYMVMAWMTMETLCQQPVGQTYPDPSDTCNPVSIQEMDRPTGLQPTIAVYSSGARTW